MVTISLKRSGFAIQVAKFTSEKTSIQCMQDPLYYFK